MQQLSDIQLVKQSAIFKAHKSKLKNLQSIWKLRRFEMDNHKIPTISHLVIRTCGLINTQTNLRLKNR